MYLVLLGSPGTGKGTQAGLLAGRFGWLHVSTGDMLREAVAAGSELGRQAQSFMDRGALVPDALVIEMLVNRLREPDAAAGFILDGFPRTLAQAIALDDALAASGKAIDFALNFEAPEEELVRRLAGRWLCPNCGEIYHEIGRPPRQAGVCDKCGGRLTQREDDSPTTVKARIERQKPPADLLEHYRRKGNLRDIEADQSREAVSADVIEAVAANQHSSAQSQR